MTRFLAPYRLAVATLTLVAAVMIVGTAQPAGAATATRSTPFGNSVTLRTYGYGASPPRGRATICVNSNTYAEISRVSARVKYRKGSLLVTSAEVLSTSNPPAGSCAIADDYEWYYTDRSITGGVFKVYLSTGAVRTYTCDLLSCW